MVTNFFEFNTEKRKDFFELKINSFLCKTMESLRKRINVELINNAVCKCVSKPTFISQKIFNKNLVTFHKIRSIFLLNKPIYVGFSILELSKLLMYDFHYR